MLKRAMGDSKLQIVFVRLQTNKLPHLFLNNNLYCRKDFYSMNIFEVNDKKKFSFSCIYLWRNLINGKVYVGQTVDFYARMKQYLHEDTNRRICMAIKKYGFNNFSVEVLEKDVSREKLTQREQYWIDFYDSANRDVGYNICPMAENTKGYRHREEDKKRMSEIAKKRFKEHPEQIKRGKDNHMFGKKHSEETRNKISQSIMGNQNVKGKTWKLSEEICRRMSERMKGKRNGLGHKCPESVKEHLRRYNKNRIWTEEMREQSRIAHLNIGGKKLMCVETGVAYESVAEAGRALSKDPSSISKCCRGQQQVAYGFHWQYI